MAQILGRLLNLFFGSTYRTPLTCLDLRKKLRNSCRDKGGERVGAEICGFFWLPLAVAGPIVAMGLLCPRRVCEGGGGASAGHRRQIRWNRERGPAWAARGGGAGEARSRRGCGACGRRDAGAGLGRCALLGRRQESWPRHGEARRSRRTGKRNRGAMTYARPIRVRGDKVETR